MLLFLLNGLKAEVLTVPSLLSSSVVISYKPTELRLPHITSKQELPNKHMNEIQPCGQFHSSSTSLFCGIHEMGRAAFHTRHHALCAFSYIIHFLQEKPKALEGGKQLVCGVQLYSSHLSAFAMDFTKNLRLNWRKNAKYGVAKCVPRVSENFYVSCLCDI